MRPAVLLRLLPLLLALTACAPRREGGPAEAAPQVALTGVQLRVFRDARLVASARAARVTYRRDTGQVQAQEAFVRLPASPDSSPEAGLTASAGARELRAREVEGSLTRRQATARGDVSLRTAGGLTGTTQLAHYAGQAQTVGASSPITLRSGAMRLEAQAWHFDLAREEFLFHEGVQTHTGDVR